MGIVVADVAVAVDITIAGAVLQRDAPLPAGLASGRSRIRVDIDRPLRWHGQGAVTGKGVAPIDIARLQRILDQQAAETGAVDEQVAGDSLSLVEMHRCHKARFRILGNMGDLALDAFDTAGLGIGPQVAGIEAGIEVIGVGQGR